MFNIQFLQSTEGQDEFLALMQAQHRMTMGMLDDWLRRKPWSYGSIDSVDYMSAALRLSDEMIDRMMDARFFEGMDYDYLMSNFACDGVCEELWTKFPDPEEGE